MTQDPSSAAQHRELNELEKSPAGYRSYSGAAHGTAASHPAAGVRKERPIPTAAGLGAAKASQQGKPPVRLVPPPVREFPLHPKVSCAHSEAPSPFKVLTPAKPFADGGLLQVSPPLLQSMLPVELHDPAACGNHHPAPLSESAWPPPGSGPISKAVSSDTISEMC